MPPPAISPDQILDYAPPSKARIVKVDANVVAYFGDLFRSLRTSLTAAPRLPVHTVLSGTGAAQNRS